MSDIRSAEDVVREVLGGGSCNFDESDWCVAHNDYRTRSTASGETCFVFEESVQSIQKRDAEVRADERARVLADFTEEWTVGARDWIEWPRDDRSREAAERLLRTSPKPAWLERRLVGAWQPVDGDEA